MGLPAHLTEHLPGRGRPCGGQANRGAWPFTAPGGVGAPAYRRVMARTGWVYGDPHYFLDSEQSHDAWVDDLRQGGWRLWMARQTWDGTPCTLDGRPTLRHDLRRWFGPGPEPAAVPGGPEGPATRERPPSQGIERALGVIRATLLRSPASGAGSSGFDQELSNARWTVPRQRHHARPEASRARHWVAHPHIRTLGDSADMLASVVRLLRTGSARPCRARRGGRCQRAGQGWPAKVTGPAPQSRG